MSPLLKMMRAMELFQTQRDEVPIQRIEAFLLVAMRRRMTRNEIAEALGVHLSSAKRNLEALTTNTYKINFKTYQGAGLLAEERDTVDSRRFVYTLTNKGQRVADQITAILGGAGGAE